MYLYAWTCMFAGNLFPLQKQLDNHKIQQVNTNVNTYNKYIGICNSTLAYSPSLVISSWWNSQISLTPTSHPWDKAMFAKRQGLRDPQDSQAPHTSAMVPDHRTEVREKWSRAVFRCVECHFPMLVSYGFCVAQFCSGPTCSKQTLSDWHFLEGYWDLLHFFSWGKGFLLSIRESWTFFVQAHHKFWINTLGQQRRKHIVLLQTLGINKISSCCTVSAIQNESNHMDHGFFKPFGSDISRGTQRGNPMEDTTGSLTVNRGMFFTSLR